MAGIGAGSALGDVNFKVTPEVLNTKANEVSGLIRKVQQEFDNLAIYIGKTNSYWIGEAGDAHRKAYEDQKANIEEIIRRLQEHPRDLVTIAQKYTETELRVEQYISALPSDVIE